MFIELASTPRDYAWGSLDGIAVFTGRPASGRPEAELWFGTHAGAPSATPRTVPPTAVAHPNLRDWVAAEPGDLLGSPDAVELPILLKVLAAGSPLSLQVHPSAEQAARGYADEEARGVPLDAFDRNYKDPYPKPEILVAVSEAFEALSGFRPSGQVAALAADIAVAAAAAGGRHPVATQPLLGLLATPDDPKPVVTWLLSGTPSVAEAVSSLTELAAGQAATTSNSVATFATIRELAQHYPGDPGVVIAALMNRVTLRAGECLFAPAGTLHAYLRGVGIELMTASDNVLRGGLTPKHIDTAELVRILSFEQGEPALLAPSHPEPGIAVYAPPAGFALSVIEPAATRRILDAGPAILLVERGAITLAGDDGAAVLGCGDAVFIPACEAAPSLSGDGRAWLATPVPRDAAPSR